METTQSSLSVFLVVPTYNGQDDIPGFFSTLQKSLVNTPYTVTVVAVDNNSHDNTVVLAREHFPAVHIIQNEENKGYAGVSAGMQYALYHGADYVAVLNQDLVFDAEWISPLVKYLSDNPNTGAVQSQILLEGEESMINSSGNALHYLGFGYTLGHKRNVSEYTPSRPLFYCSGACVMFRADALKKVGLFDEIFFLYHEDTDLSWRLRLAGYDLAMVSDSVVYHKYVFSKSTLKFFYIERNRLLTLFKNYEVRTLLLISPMLLVTEGAMLASSVIGSLLRVPMLGFFSKMRTYGFFMKKSTWKYIRQQRGIIHSQRQKRDRDLVPFMVSDIAFQDLSSPIVKYAMNPLTRAYWAIIKPLI